MPKPKAKNEVALLEPLDTMKPLVKDFVDAEKDLHDFVDLRLPSVPKASPVIKQVYVNKTKTVFRYRVNYWAVILHDDCFVPTGKIVKSLYIEVKGTPSEGYTFTDITGQKP